VILPSFTFVATANAVVATVAKPVFIDIVKSSYTIDPNKIERLITPRTKAIIPVHLYGHPAEMSTIMEVGKKHSLLVIEDACQSVGASYLGKQTGSIGDVGCFSMYASKVLTSGEGGAVSTNNDSIAAKLRMIRNHGMVHGYDTQTLGLNMRLPEINAALATTQMKKLSTMLEVRRRNAKLYHDALNSISKRKGVSFTLPVEGDGRLYNWYLYTVALPGTRDRVKNHLNAKGIGATVYHNPPVHKTPYYLDLCPDIDLPVTEESADDVLSLPVHPLVSEIEVQLICDKIKEVLT
jgi:perosamine synthetase